MSLILGPFSLERIERAVEKIRQRLLRATGALEKAGVPYAVAGGHAVAAWVSRADEAAVRTTRDVDLLVRRSDLPAVRAALEPLGFLYRHSAGMDMFLEGPQGKARDAVHMLFAGEKVRDEELLPNPDVTESEPAEEYRVLTLPALVQIKLTAFRDKDRMHLRDLLEVGLVDESFLQRYPPELAARLKLLIDTPGG